MVIQNRYVFTHFNSMSDIISFPVDEMIQYKTSRTSFMHFKSETTSVDNWFLNKDFTKVFLNN